MLVHGTCHRCGVIAVIWAKSMITELQVIARFNPAVLNSRQLQSALSVATDEGHIGIIQHELVNIEVYDDQWQAYKSQTARLLKNRHITEKRR